MSLFYGDAIRAIFRLAVQPSHLSLLLVVRRVCCLSLGKQQRQSRLDSQSDGIIQPSIKLCGQQKPNCSSRERERAQSRISQIKCCNLLVRLSLHMPTENQWGFFSCCAYPPVDSTSPLVFLFLLSFICFQSHIPIPPLPLEKFLHWVSQLSLLI